MNELYELRYQLEEFAISLKPGTTKGKHRTAIFDTVELAKLVQALIAIKVREARIETLQWALNDYNMPDTDTKANLEVYIAELGEL